MEELNPELESRGFEQVPLKGQSVANNSEALRSHWKRKNSFLEDDEYDEDDDERTGWKPSSLVKPEPVESSRLEKESRHLDLKRSQGSEPSKKKVKPRGVSQFFVAGWSHRYSSSVFEMLFSSPSKSVVGGGSIFRIEEALVIFRRISPLNRMMWAS